jgi:hypothetical protein
MPPPPPKPADAALRNAVGLAWTALLLAVIIPPRRHRAGMVLYLRYARNRGARFGGDCESGKARLLCVDGRRMPRDTRRDFDALLNSWNKPPRESHRRTRRIRFGFEPRRAQYARCVSRTHRAVVRGTCRVLLEIESPTVGIDLDGPDAPLGGFGAFSALALPWNFSMGNSPPGELFQVAIVLALVLALGHLLLRAAQIYLPPLAPAFDGAGPRPWHKWRRVRTPHDGRPTQTDHRVVPVGRVARGCSDTAHAAIRKPRRTLVGE